MTKDDLIKKFPIPQFSKFPDNKINELIDLCLDTAKSYHQVNDMIYNYIKYNFTHSTYLIFESDTVDGELSKDEFENNFNYESFYAWYYGYLPKDSYNTLLKYGEYLNGRTIDIPTYSIQDWIKDVEIYFKLTHKSHRTLFDACKLISDIVYKDVFDENYQSLRTKYHTKQTLMLQGLGILLKQNSMSKVTNENKEKFYKELMKYFMYPKYFGYMKENYRYSLSKKKLPRKTKKFLHNPMVNNISGRNKFNKIKQNLFYNRIYSDYGPYGEFLNIFRNAGISDEIARKICPWKESAMINFEDMSVVVNGIYY